MRNVQRAWEGVAKATGTIGLFTAGLPVHLRPDVKRIGFGSDVSGNQRVAPRNYAHTLDTTNKTMQVIYVAPTGDSIVLTADMTGVTADATASSGGSVVLEGTNSEPGVGPWVVIGTVTSNGAVSSLIPYRWVRATTGNLGSSGAVKVFIATSS